MTCHESENCLHRPAATALLKCHLLCFQSTNLEKLLQACRLLRQLVGVRIAEPAPDGIRLEYDLLRITLQQIEVSCAEAGLRGKGGLHGWRRSWWKYTEGNERQNTLHPPAIACCNRPPNDPR